MKLLDEDLVTIRSAARWFGRKANAEIDELISIAVIELLEEEEPIIDKDKGKRKDLVRTIATNAMKEFLMEGRPTIKIPTRSSSRHDLKDMHQVPIDPQTFAISESMGPAETVAINDSLLHAAETPLEKEYMKLRIAGSTNLEATVELDITVSRACRLLWKIEQRFMEEWYE